MYHAYDLQGLSQKLFSIQEAVPDTWSLGNTASMNKKVNFILLIEAFGQVGEALELQDTW